VHKALFKTGHLADAGTFSFGDYYDAEFVSFGALRVFNDDTLSPGDQALSVYGAAMIRDQDRIDIAAQEDAELLLVEVML
jgi:hypothetical protein